VESLTKVDFSRQLAAGDSEELGCLFHAKFFPE
jgi:hypothetical protein